MSRTIAFVYEHLQVEKDNHLNMSANETSFQSELNYLIIVLKVFRFANFQELPI